MEHCNTVMYKRLQEYECRNRYMRITYNSKTDGGEVVKTPQKFKVFCKAQPIEATIVRDETLLNRPEKFSDIQYLFRIIRHSMCTLSGEIGLISR